MGSPSSTPHTTRANSTISGRKLTRSSVASTKQKYDDFMGAVQRKLGKVTSSSNATWNVQSFNMKTSVVMTQKTIFEHGQGTESFTFELDGDERRAGWLQYPVYGPHYKMTLSNQTIRASTHYVEHSAPVIEHELSSSERLLWSGQPRRGVRLLGPSDAFAHPIQTPMLSLRQVLGDKHHLKGRAFLL